VVRGLFSLPFRFAEMFLEHGLDPRMKNLSAVLDKLGIGKLPEPEETESDTGETA